MDPRRHAALLSRLIIAGTVVLGCIIGVVTGSVEHSFGWGIAAAIASGFGFMVIGIGMAMATKGVGRLFRRSSPRR